MLSRPHFPQVIALEDIGIAPHGFVSELRALLREGVVVPAITLETPINGVTAARSLVLVSRDFDVVPVGDGVQRAISTRPRTAALATHEFRPLR